MPARDIYHECVKNALVKDGWTVTHDPLRLSWGAKDMYVDLGAERLLTAEKQEQKIAVEVKSFIGASEINDIEDALGQYFLYRSVLTRTEPERVLYIAINEEVFDEVFEEPLGQLLLEDYKIALLVFNSQEEVITKWLK
ncbi:MAG: XisH family protein [bacterium]